MSAPPKGVSYIRGSAYPMYMGLATSEKAYKQEMVRLKISNAPPFTTADATTHFFPIEGRTPVCLVCLDPKNEHDLVLNIGLLVHEATHVWQFLKREMGEDKPGWEIEAYFIQWFSQFLIAESGITKPQRIQMSKKKGKGRGRKGC